MTGFLKRLFSMDDESLQRLSGMTHPAEMTPYEDLIAETEAQETPQDGCRLEVAASGLLYHTPLGPVPFRWENVTALDEHSFTLNGSVLCRFSCPVEWSVRSVPPLARPKFTVAEMDRLIAQNLLSDEMVADLADARLATAAVLGSVREVAPSLHPQCILPFERWLETLRRMGRR